MTLFKYGKRKLDSTRLFTTVAKKYNNCENCGSDRLGGEPSEGGLHYDGQNGYFKRSCKCGWEIELNFEKVVD